MKPERSEETFVIGNFEVTIRKVPGCQFLALNSGDNTAEGFTVRLNEDAVVSLAAVASLVKDQLAAIPKDKKNG